MSHQSLKNSTQPVMNSMKNPNSDAASPVDSGFSEPGMTEYRNTPTIAKSTEASPRDVMFRFGMTLLLVAVVLDVSAVIFLEPSDCEINNSRFLVKYLSSALTMAAIASMLYPVKNA